MTTRVFRSLSLAALTALFAPCLFAAELAADSKSEAKAEASLPGVVVDKKTNTLYLVKFSDLGIETIKTYHTTLGLVAGDKRKEGDKKTPEGIYFVEEVKRAPNLEKKFGRLALTLNYPNPWDKLQNYTGSGIWFHATDDPSRLARNFDSLGCVVVKDEEIHEIFPQLKYRVSPVVVYEDAQKEMALRTPAKVAEIKTFVMLWAHAWASKDMDTYIASYSSKFKGDGKNLSQWSAQKKQLTKAYAKIQVDIDNIHIFTHPKYDVAIFNQHYASELPSGAKAKNTSGVKILYLSHEESSPKILSEQFRETHI